MDNYPDHIAPEFDEQGAVATPFEEWWAIARLSFPHVPEEVARDWLHRHWRYSPYDWLPSSEYRFTRRLVPSGKLNSIRSNENNFGPDHREIVEEGRWLVEDQHRKWPLELVTYMLDAGSFPVPPVILDNRDGHLPEEKGPFPNEVILIEGHRRFKAISYLASIGRARAILPFWLMTHIRH